MGVTEKLFEWSDPDTENKRIMFLSHANSNIDLCF